VKGNTMPVEQEAGTVTTEQAVALLLLDGQAQLRRLEREGAFKQIAPGRYWLKDLVQGFVRHSRKDASVSSYELAAHLGCVRSYLDKLQAMGVITKLADGRFDQDACRMAYLKHLRTERRLSPRGAADVALQQAKAELVGLRVAERKASLIPAVQHEARCEAIAGVVLSALSSMPAQVAIADLSVRRRLERWAYDTRKSIAKVMLAKADAEGEPEAPNGKEMRSMPANGRAAV
jgi:hypothetical protein